MRFVIVFFISFLSIVVNSQSLRFAKVFSDHSVLQRDQALPIWGWTIPNDEVSLIFKNRSYKTMSDAKGKWRIQLPPTSYGGPYDLKLSNRTSKIVLKDVYVGDVWICSGQSNMSFQLSQSFEKFEPSGFEDKLIRHFRVPKSFSNHLSEELEGGEWKVGEKESIGAFSAVAYYFAKSIRKEFPHLPIGLINNSWGGARIEPFMSARSFEKNQEEILNEIKYNKEQFKKKQLAKLSYLETIPEKDKGMKKGKALWAKNLLKDTDWKFMKLPIQWEKAGLKSLDGIVWFRKRFTINKLTKNSEVVLSLGRIDDDAEIWLNEVRIDNLFDRSYEWSDLREYKLSSTYFKKGVNQIITRVTDTGGGGGMCGSKEELYVNTGLEKINLSGQWKYKIGEVFLNFLYGPKQQPTTIYNKMVYPINNFKAKGVLWYQGESNTKTKEEAIAYEDQFKILIQQWRRDRKSEELPFYFVQLASFKKENITPKDDIWAYLRASQFNTLELFNTGMASAIDIGNADDIHPKNKKDVGERLSLIALNQLYDKTTIAFKNPSYHNHIVEGNKFIIEFKDYGKRLQVKDKYGYVNGFALADENGNFKWAKAVLKENKVEVWHDEIEQPTSLRYGWSSNALKANLYSSYNLPVVPFKID